jgi:hypothetical protein
MSQGGRSVVDAFGCLGFPRAHVALDGVWSGLVESAVGRSDWPHAEQHRCFGEILERAIDEAKAALGPVLDPGAYHLPEEELSLLHEIDFNSVRSAR